jgi:hypothetical protein
MGKQLGVRQMQQAASGVGHGIGFSSNVIDHRNVSVIELVECLETNEMRRWYTGRGGPFPFPLDCSNVVR